MQNWRCIILAWQSEEFIYCRLLVRLPPDESEPDPLAWFVLETIKTARVGGIVGRAEGRAVVASCFVNPSSSGAIEWSRIPTLAILLGFLNALACSNVAVERLTSKRGALKAAKPVDAYHVLVIRGRHDGNGACNSGAAHRSPREHVRRGHVRRLLDGRRIWVNVCVVARGAPGKVTKDYALRAPA
jgi:hypothetical protein